MDSDDRHSRERYDQEREQNRSLPTSNRSHQHGLPSVPPLGSKAPAAGGGLIRMGDVISGGGSGAHSDGRGHSSLPKPLGFAPPRKRGRSPSPNGNSSFKGPRESYDLPRSSTSSGMPPSRSRDYDYDYDYTYEYDYDSRAPVRSYRGRSRGPPDDYEVYPTGKDGYRPPSKIRPAGDRDGRYGPREYERERERDRYEDHYRRDGYDYDYAYGRDYESGGYGRDYRGGERRSREYYDDGHGYDYSSEYDYGYGHDYGYEDDWGGRGGRDYGRERDYWMGIGAEADASSHASAKANKEAGGVFDPFKNSGLLNFRSFADLAKSAGHPSYEAKDKLFAEYSAYRLEFQKRLLKTFFEEHCDKVWFKEKYFYKDADGYDYEEDRKMRIKKGREGRKEIWVKELQAGEIDEVNWDLKAASKDAVDVNPPGPDIHGNDGVPAGFDVPASIHTRNGKEIIQHENAIIPADPNLLFFLAIPPDQPRKELERILRKEEGFQYLALAEPNALKHNMRVGWARFDDGVDISGMVNRLNPIHADNAGLPQVGSSTIPLGVVNKRATARLRIIPEFATCLKRMRFDLFQARRLVSLCEEQDKSLFREGDSEETVTDLSEEIRKRVREMKDGAFSGLLEQEEAREKIVENKWKESEDMDLRLVRESDEEGSAKDLDEEALEKRKELVRTLLDLSIDCLRQVFNLDYYACVQTEYPDELVRRATLSVRKTPQNGRSFESIKTGKDGSQEEFWQKSLDDRTALLLDAKVDLVPHGGVNIQNWILEEAKTWVQEAGPEKFRCIVEIPTAGEENSGATQQCGKLFKGSMFVQKHVANKHQSFLDEKISSKLEKQKVFNCYVSDPARPMSQYHLSKTNEHNDPRSYASRPRPRGSGARRGGGMLGNGSMRMEPYNSDHRHRSRGGHSSSNIPASAGSGNVLIRIGNSRPSVTEDVMDESTGPRSGNSQAGFKHSGNGSTTSSLSSRLGPKPTGNDAGGSKSGLNGNGNETQAQSLADGQPLDPRATKQQSYHDLDGPATGAAELELNY